MFSENSYINTNDTGEQFRFLSVAKVYIRSLLIRSLSLVARNSFHYANMSVQYTAVFHVYKNDYFQLIIFYNFLIFAQNIDCRYTLRGSSNKEWDFFHGAVNLHARLLKYHTYLVHPLGSSRVTFLS